MNSHQCHSPSPVPWAPEAGHPCGDTPSPGSGRGSPGLCWQSPRPGTDFRWSSWPRCRGSWIPGGDQEGNPSSHGQVTRSPPPHLVQRPHRNFAYIVGHVLPAGALRVARRDPCSVPQVPWGEKQPGSSEKSFGPILAGCGVSPWLPLQSFTPKGS